MNRDAVQEVESAQQLNVFSKSGQKIVGTVATTDNKVEVTTKDAGLSTALSKYLSWNLAYSSRYLSNPPLPGIKKNDTLLSTGIRFTFAK